MRKTMAKSTGSRGRPTCILLSTFPPPAAFLPFTTLALPLRVGRRKYTQPAFGTPARLAALAGFELYVVVAEVLGAQPHLFEEGFASEEAQPPAVGAVAVVTPLRLHHGPLAAAGAGDKHSGLLPGSFHSITQLNSQTIYTMEF